MNNTPRSAVFGRASVWKGSVLQEEARVTLEEAQNICASLWNDIARTSPVSSEIFWLKLWEVLAIRRAIRAVREARCEAKARQDAELMIAQYEDALRLREEV
jgi:hypothetical protein